MCDLQNIFKLLFLNVLKSIKSHYLCNPFGYGKCYAIALKLDNKFHKDILRGGAVGSSSGS